MKWFKKQDESPRLLSLSPLRLSEARNDVLLSSNLAEYRNPDPDTPNPQPGIRHKSRIGKDDLDGGLEGNIFLGSASSLKAILFLYKFNTTVLNN